MNDALEKAVEEVLNDFHMMSQKEFDEALEEAKDDPLYDTILEIIEARNP